MAKYLVRFRPAWGVAGLGLVLTWGLYWGLKSVAVFPVRPPAAQHGAIAGGTVRFAQDAPRLSKCQITLQVMQFDAAIRDLEKTGAVPGPLGVQIYGPETSARLFENYQAVQTRLAYLNNGREALKALQGDWEGYSFREGNSFRAGRNRPVQMAEIREPLRYLEQYRWAGNFLGGFRIFLLPYAIPDVSGLGGAGYSMLSALGPAAETSESAAREIGVTLDHEIGHHLHLSKMPEDTAVGRRLWRQYLKLRDAVWHGPGKVKTQAWSNSSEETFAEDFRMLFGKDQPYYQDVALGDPRGNPAMAAQLRRFMARVAARPVLSPYQSPWQPEAASLLFWRAQWLVIALLWLVLGVCYGAVAISGTKITEPPSAFPAA